MNQPFVGNLEDDLVHRLKQLAAKNGISAEDQHRRLLADALDTISVLKEPLADYLLNHPVLPQIEIPIERLHAPEDRDCEM